MERFLLLIREDLQKFKNSGPDHFDKCLRAMMGWMEALAESGNYVAAEPLENGGRYIRRDVVLSDGPFVEAKEAISGYVIIKAENLEQAASIAQNCPLLIQGIAVVEVRPIMIVNNG